MRILKVNTYAPDSPLYQAFGPDVTFDIHRAGAEAVAPPVAESCRLADAVINCAASLPIGVEPDGFERCRIVVREGVGYDNLDLEGWGARGVPVCNVPDYGTTEVADHALALTLALTRGTGAYDEALRNNLIPGWTYKTAPLVRRLRGATFAVLGLGRIGLATARRAAAFDMKVIFHDPYLSNGAELAVGYERVRSLEEFMARADILSVHTPLTEETRGLIGEKTLAHAKPELIVINTARGPIVDLDALASALRERRIAGAGLDVLPQEPADMAHPLIAAWLAGDRWVRRRLILTPHAAFYSPSALEDMQRKAIEVIVSYLRDGTLMNCVNQQYLKARP
ncbi:C-terminal binding protein [Bauldia litoralis]|uniref:C-terminal binding protein n=1 Tax=Bauldia litoralis TaxID=665467 RepID=UPI0032664C0D